MAFYAEHFIEIHNGIIVQPTYLYRRWCHSLRFSLGSFKVGSHHLWIRTDHHMDREDRVCRLCTLAEVESETHSLFRCPTTMRSKGDFTVFSEIVSLFQSFSAMLISGVLHFIFGRPPNFVSILFSWLCLRSTPLTSSLPPFTPVVSITGGLKGLPALLLLDQSGIVPIFLGNDTPPMDLSEDLGLRIVHSYILLFLITLCQGRIHSPYLVFLGLLSCFVSFLTRFWCFWWAQLFCLYVQSHKPFWFFVGH